MPLTILLESSHRLFIALSQISLTALISPTSLSWVSQTALTPRGHTLWALWTLQTEITITLRTTTQPQCPNIHNIPILYALKFMAAYPLGDLGLCLGVPFSKTRSWTSEEPLPVPIPGLIAVWHDKGEVQIISSSWV